MAYDKVQIEFCLSPSERPLIANDQYRSDGKILLEQIKEWRSEEQVEISHFLTRRDRSFAITHSDHQIYWIGSPTCHKLANRMKVYFVASSYGHIMFLTDPIDKNTGKCEDFNSHGYAIHQLPNGHSYKVPKRSSVIGLGMYGSKELYGSKTQALKLDLTDSGILEVVHMKDLDTCLAINEYIVYISAAAYTSILLTNQGRIYLTGSNGFGELGFHTEDKKTEKVELHPIHKKEPNLFFTKTACGDHNIFAITKDGLLYVTGYNNSDELGLGSSNSVFEFKPSKLFNHFAEKDPFYDVACHYYGAILLGKSGSVYISGGSKRNIRKFSIPPSHDGFTKYLSVGSNANSLFAIASNQTSILLTQFTRDLNEIYHTTHDCSYDSHRYSVAITGSENNTMTCILLRNETFNTKFQSNLALHLTLYSFGNERTFVDLLVNFQRV